MKYPANPGRRSAIRKTARLAGFAALANTSLQGIATANGAAEGAEKKLPKYGIQGYEAPELDVGYWIDADGEPSKFSIEDSKGNWILLKCFQNWCPGCHSSGFPFLQAFAKEFHDNPDVSIAAIQTVFEGFDTNTQDAVRELQLEYKLPIMMGHDAGDPEGLSTPDTMLKYRTGGTPWIILIDPNGMVAFNDFRVNTRKLIRFLHEQVG